MRTIVKRFVPWILMGAFGQTALADASGYFASPKPQDPDGFREVFVQVAPDIYMAGQPSPDALAKAQSLGVTTVINLRTDMEMDNRDIVPFDEQQIVADLGMQYVHIPQGGPDTPYARDAVDQFAQTLEQADGKVLLHCTVAWRATHLWTAYLVQHQGLSLAAAVAIARQLNFGTLPLEGFLGQPLTVEVLDDNS